MVAIVHQSSSIRNALYYNENKLKQNVAELIHSGNYPKDTELLGLSDKINRLERQALLNQRTKVNSVHISLNFDVSEKLSIEKLKQVADVYMQKIGFGEQPYLVYQHYDSGHPHLHIVTTNIEADGKRIELHNLARNQSLKASLEIEKEFKLVQALNKQRLGYELKPVNVQRVQYGRSETKRAITNVLDHVLPNYKFTSVAELNAVLNQYNIVADIGSKDSRIYQNKGLVYRILNENGEKVGVPIKASLIYNKPILKFIESKFSINEEARQKYKQRVRNAIDLSFAKRPGQPLHKLMKDLEKDQIQMVLRQNNKGIVYGMTYVDHKTKCVFNGSDLGKQYSANALRLRCLPEIIQRQKLQELQNKLTNVPAFEINASELTDNITGLLRAENENTLVPYELRQRHKRKRKRRLRQ